ncbi:MAG: hypothetical protein WAO58_06145 [Fimbriimonadaceae bacterium]
MRWFALIAVLTAPIAQACINDRDTLSFEIRNVDALNRITNETDFRKKAAAIQELALKAIGGRFERYPPKYYEMRIERLEAKPSLTAAEFDDLAVAYDRLGKVDRAIGIILESEKERKTGEDTYRFHANYGTFLVHQWIVRGASRKNINLLKRSIQQIQAALKINPNSHFGRERAQLQLQLSWLYPGKNGLNYEKVRGMLSNEDLLVGLAGISMMGLGYELPDLYMLMAKSYLVGGASTSMLQEFAALRARELVSQGKPFIVEQHIPPSRGTDEVRQAYVKLRRDGQRVHIARLAYMNPRLERGEHPDTNPNFWADWEEPAVPVLRIIQRSAVERVLTPGFYIILGTVATVAILVLLGRRRRVRTT